MTHGFEEAKSQRNWLERLGQKIPGYRGFQDRELRREVDRAQREHLSKVLGEIKGRLRKKVESYTDAGQIGALTPFERLDKRLDGLSQAVRFADYGATGLFDPVKIRERELEQLYRFDLEFLDHLQGLESAAEAIPDAGASDPKPALERALEHLEQIRRRWSERETVISDVVQTAGSPPPPPSG